MEPSLLHTEPADTLFTEDKIKDEILLQSKIIIQFNSESHAGETTSEVAAANEPHHKRENYASLNQQKR